MVDAAVELKYALVVVPMIPWAYAVPAAVELNSCLKFHELLLPLCKPKLLVPVDGETLATIKVVHTVEAGQDAIVKGSTPAKYTAPNGKSAVL